MKCLWSDPLLCGSAWFQMGSYFGSSLCAVDLNQDGLSDLLVGAPMHSQLRDEGQVSVYLSKGNVSGMCGSVGTQCHDLKIYFTTVCLVPLFKLHIYISVLLSLSAVWIFSSAHVWFLSARVCYHDIRIKQWSIVWFSSEIMSPTKTKASVCTFFIYEVFCEEDDCLFGC